MTERTSLPQRLRAVNTRVWRAIQPFAPWTIVAVLCATGVATFNGMIPLDSPLFVPRQFEQTFDFETKERPASCLAPAVDALPVEERRAKQEACDLARETLRNEREMVIQATRTTNSAEEELRQSWQQTLIAFLQALLTVLALVFTGWAAFAASRASRAAERSVKQAEKSANVQLRAYVHVEEVHMLWTANTKPLFDVTCRNTGQTPAQWFEISIKCVVKRKDDAVPPVPLEGRAQRWPVPIGSDAIRSARVEGDIDEEIDWEKIVRSRSAIFALGRLRYKDVFGTIHDEEFVSFQRTPTDRKQKMAFSTAVPLGHPNPAVAADDPE